MMSDSPPEVAGGVKRVRLKLSTPEGMPPGSSMVKVQLAPIKIRLGGLAPQLFAPKLEDAPRADEIYRGQIEVTRREVEVMHREVERLTLDNKLLRTPLGRLGLGTG